MKTHFLHPIIIVDDDEDDQYFLKRTIQKFEIKNEIICFSNGQDLLQYLKTTDTDPSLILCDINMPLMNGLEVRYEINTDDLLKQKSIPFIFFSTAASPDQVREAFGLHVQGFFRKGQSVEEIESTLKVILDYWRLCHFPLVRELRENRYTTGG